MVQSQCAYVCGLLLACCLSLVPAQAQERVAVIQVTGAVLTPTTLDRQALEKMPQTQVQVGSRAYTGVSLWTLLNTIGIVRDASRHNPLVSMYVLAIGRDGYRAVFSLAELDPDLGAQVVLVAHRVDGDPISQPGGGPARLITPDDRKPS